MEKQKRTRRNNKNTETPKQEKQKVARKSKNPAPEKVEVKVDLTKATVDTEAKLDPKLLEGTGITKVETKTEKPATKTPKKKDYTAFYKKYPHVVPGSVREPTEEDKKALPKCHGMVCTIKCVDTGKLRVINTQDAFQVRRTEEATAAYRKKNRNPKPTKKQQAPVEQQPSQ